MALSNVIGIRERKERETVCSILRSARSLSRRRQRPRPSLSVRRVHDGTAEPRAVARKLHLNPVAPHDVPVGDNVAVRAENDPGIRCLAAVRTRLRLLDRVPRADSPLWPP